MRLCVSQIVTNASKKSLTEFFSYTFAIGIASAAIYSFLEPIEKSTGLTLGDLNAGTGYMVEDFLQF